MSSYVRTVSCQGAQIEVEISGEGPTVLLVHGFPHTRDLWARVTPGLARSRTVIAMDLRGCGGSSRATEGYDADSLSTDLLTVLDATGHDAADVVAIDAGVPPSFVLAATRPERVRRLVLMEGTLGTLPGAEDFFAAGPPWWFGFHSVPGLAETVLAGHEAAYLDFFYRTGTRRQRGIDPEVRERFVAAYSGTESLRGGFEHYRAMPTTARQLGELVVRGRLTVPTLAIGAAPVGDALYRQLAGVCEDLRGELLPNCGHLVPLDRPAKLLALLDDFLPGAASAARA